MDLSGIKDLDYKILNHTENEIQEFISENVNKLDTVVETMYFDYRNGGELSDLRHAQLDWYREYLFESFPTDMFYEEK